MPQGAHQKAAAPTKRGTAQSAVHASKSTAATRPFTVTRSKTRTTDSAAAAPAAGNKAAASGGKRQQQQQQAGKRRRDRLEDEAADSAETAGGDGSHDIYAAEIVWSNKRKDADEGESADGQRRGAEPEEANEQYDSDEDAPAPAAITAKQLKTLEPLVRQTQKKIREQLQQEGTASKQSKQSKQTAQQGKQTTKQPAQSKAAVKASAKQQPAKRQKKQPAAQTEEEDDEDGEEEEQKSAKQTDTAQEEQAEEDDDDEQDADDADNDGSTPTQPTNPPTRARRTRHSSTPTPSAAELAQRGVVYLGHLPHGFFEDQMRAFFTQFGEVTRVQLARNPKTGRSRHYGFVEFAHGSVASLVADAMHRYMMFGHTLVATVVPADKRHPGLFDKDGMRFRVVPHRKMARVAHNAARSVDEQQKRVSRLLRKDGKKRRELAALGVEYDFPGYVSSHKALSLAARAHNHCWCWCCLRATNSCCCYRLC